MLWSVLLLCLRKLKKSILICFAYIEHIKEEALWLKKRKSMQVYIAPIVDSTVVNKSIKCFYRTDNFMNTKRS